MDYFPNNTLASFTTRLPEMLDLDGSWEIELLNSAVHKVLFSDSTVKL
jgi:hypothetical protein